MKVVFFFKNVTVHLYPKHCSAQINSQCLEPGTPVQSMSGLGGCVSLDGGTLGHSVLPYETGMRRLLLAELDEILCDAGCCY